MILAVLTLLTVAVLAELGGRVIVARLALPIFESSPPFQIPPYPRTPAAEPLSIPVSIADSARLKENAAASLAAILLQPTARPPRGLIIFCPEFGADRWSCQGYCEGLRERGFAILAFDFRSQGASSPVHGEYQPTHWVTSYERDDVLTVIRWALAEPRLQQLPLYLMGVSRGAGAAISAAAICPQVCAVVADGAFSPRTMMQHFFYRWARLYVPDWLPSLLPRWYVATLLRPVEWIAGWRRGVRFVHLEPALRRMRSRPILMISGERDSYCVPRFTHRLQRLTRQERSRAWIVPEARHNGARKANPAAYDARIDEFLAGATETPSLRAAIPSPHLARRKLITETGHLRRVRCADHE